MGTGAFGKVYLYHHPEKLDDKVAIKLEKPNLSSASLTNEEYFTRILNEQHKLDCVLKYYGYSFHNHRSFIIIEYIDSTLESYLALPRHHLGKKSLVQLSQEAMENLQKLHGTQHLHRNVKPDHFMISKVTNKLKIIDLGLAIAYMPDGVHRPMGKYAFKGTPNFGSINTLYGYNSSRRDDLESLGYSIMFLIDEQAVPWRTFQNKQEIRDCKI